MVQVGNVHIGKADKTKEPTLSILEAGLLWDALVARYSCIEETQIYYNYAKDVEFKAIISKIGLNLLEKQARQIEKQLEIYKIPLPQRPPKTVSREDDSMILSDRFMFTKIFEGCQTFIDYMAYCTRSIITNDPLRQMFADFLKEEISIFNNLCKYAKLKGWIEPAPNYN
jgi:hypothetical protein